MPIYICEADKNTVIHFGHGDLIVSASADLTEVIITPAIGAPGTIGERTDEYDGATTADIPPGIRLVFDDPASALVVADALSRIAQAMFAQVKTRMADYAELCRENSRLHKIVELSRAVEADREAQTRPPAKATGEPQ